MPPSVAEPRATVCKEHDQRIIQFSRFFQMGENAAKILIDTVDHGAIAELAITGLRPTGL